MTDNQSPSPITSPLLRRAAQKIHKIVASGARIADRGHAKRVAKTSRDAHATVVADTLTSHRLVDRVDAELTRHFGSTTRLAIRVWVKTNDAQLDATQIADQALPGAASTTAARDCQHKQLADIAGHQWQQTGAEVTDDYLRATKLLDTLTATAWKAMRGEQAALDMVLVSTDLEHPWAIGMEALGENAVLTPAAATRRYPSSSR